MQVPTGHPNGGAQKAGPADAKESDFQQDLEVLCGEGTDSQGKAQSKGSIHVYVACKRGQMGTRKRDRGHEKEAPV